MRDSSYYKTHMLQPRKIFHQVLLVSVQPQQCKEQAGVDNYKQNIWKGLC